MFACWPGNIVQYFFPTDLENCETNKKIQWWPLLSFSYCPVPIVLFMVSPSIVLFLLSFSNCPFLFSFSYCPFLLSFSNCPFHIVLWSFSYCPFPIVLFFSSSLPQLFRVILQGCNFDSLLSSTNVRATIWKPPPIAPQTSQTCPKHNVSNISKKTSKTSPNNFPKRIWFSKFVLGLMGPY